MPKRGANTGRKAKSANKRAASSPRKPIDVEKIIWWAITIAAVAVMFSIVIQAILPPKAKATMTQSEQSSSTRETSNKATWTAYNNEHKEGGKRMIRDEEGILRDADEIRIDDLGRPIWVGGGLRRSDV